MLARFAHLTPTLTPPSPYEDADPTETREWLDSIGSVMRIEGPERAHFLLEKLVDFTRRSGTHLPFKPNTAYLNSISKAQEPDYPGDRSLERRIEAYLRWNALAMVVHANRASSEYGGHIAGYASAATLYEVGFNHFWRARSSAHPGDLIFSQGHSSPGIYARAYLEGRLDEAQLQTFAKKCAAGACRPIRTPAGVEQGILSGMYLLRTGGPGEARVTLFGSGTILREVLAAAELLEREFDVAADVYSVTSFSELRRNALAIERWNLLHPSDPSKQPYIRQALGEREGPFVAATDYIKLVPDQIRQWVPGRYPVLGTDGFGRSDSRAELRRFFEIDRRYVTAAALKALTDDRKIDAHTVTRAMQIFDIDPEKPNPRLT